jgi:hypothetical protein
MSESCHLGSQELLNQWRREQWGVWGGGHYLASKAVYEGCTKAQHKAVYPYIAAKNHRRLKCELFGETDARVSNDILIYDVIIIIITPWPEPESELYRPSDRSLLAKLVPTFAVRGRHVVTVTDPYGRISRFLARKKNC